MPLTLKNLGKVFRSEKWVLRVVDKAMNRNRIGSLEEAALHAEALALLFLSVRMSKHQCSSNPRYIRLQILAVWLVVTATWDDEAPEVAVVQQLPDVITANGWISVKRLNKARIHLLNLLAWNPYGWSLSRGLRGFALK